MLNTETDTTERCFIKYVLGDLLWKKEKQPLGQDDPLPLAS